MFFFRGQVQEILVAFLDFSELLACDLISAVPECNQNKISHQDAIRLKYIWQL